MILVLGRVAAGNYYRVPGNCPLASLPNHGPPCSSPAACPPPTHTRARAHTLTGTRTCSLAPRARSVTTASASGTDPRPCLASSCGEGGGGLVWLIWAPPLLGARCPCADAVAQALPKGGGGGPHLSQADQPGVERQHGHARGHGVQVDLGARQAGRQLTLGGRGESMGAGCSPPPPPITHVAHPTTLKHGLLSAPRHRCAPTPPHPHTPPRHPPTCRKWPSSTATRKRRSARRWAHTTPVAHIVSITALYTMASPARP